MNLTQLALDSSMPQAWCEELQNSDRVTIDATDFSKLTVKVWDVYQDNPGEFQLRITLQGVCDDAYNLLPLPELKEIKQTPGFFTLSGFVLVCKDEIPFLVFEAMQNFADWTKSNQGVKTPEGRPSLWPTASSEAIVQLVIEPYTNNKNQEVFSFNGWAHQGLTWSGSGITSRPQTKRYVLAGGFAPPAPPVPPVFLLRR